MGFRNLAAGPLTLVSWLLLAIAVTACAPQAQATSISLGVAKDFSVLALNGSYVYMGSGATIVNGDFGIGPNSFGLLDNGTINGTLYLDTTSAANVTVNPLVTIAGGTSVVDLGPPNSDAIAASASFAALPVNRPDVTAITGNLTITGNGGDNVFSLTSVDMTARTLTLNGTADDYFIFNVTGDLHFQASNILLGGSVTASHVIFNVIGALPGNPVDLSANGTFRGTILAPDRAIQAETLLVIGALIGGRDSSFDEFNKDGASMSLHSSATINYVPFAEASAEGCIEITKSVSPAKGPVGTPITYTFLVENCGTIDLTITSITDTVLGNLTAAFVADHGGNVLAAGTSETFGVASAIPGDKGNPIENTVTVIGQANSTLYVDSDYAVVTVPITISGGAYLDVGCDGILDASDNPLPGAMFVLTDINGHPVNDLDGSPVAAQVGSTFSFTNLAPGIYRVTEINPMGYISTNAVPGVGGTKLTNDAIRVDASDGFDFPNQVFLDGLCEQLLYQAYPGNSFGTNVTYAGYADSFGDNTTSVPGILHIIPQDEGEPKWANFIHAYQEGTYTSNEQLEQVTLTKQTPQLTECDVWFPQATVIQHGTPNIRLWWPLMYEVPDTTWTLEIRYLDNGPKTETWVWRMDATLQSLKDTLQLFHEVPYGLIEVPLVSDEVLYPVLQAKLDAAIAAINGSDLGLAGEILTDFEMEVASAVLAMVPDYPNPTGSQTGIVQTAENPAACKLMADAWYIAAKYGLFVQAK